MVRKKNRERARVGTFYTVHVIAIVIIGNNELATIENPEIKVDLYHSVWNSQPTGYQNEL